MNQILLILFLSFWHFLLNDAERKIELSETEKWKVGWRMIISSMEANYNLGEIQFDSLLATNSKIDKKFVSAGLEILSKKEKNEKIQKVLKQLDKETLTYICNKNNVMLARINTEICQPYAVAEKVENPVLQKELIIMFINDQAVRGGNMDKLISKYNLLKEEVVKFKDGISTDEENRNKLKNIFANYGFPNKKMVGADAMEGIFWIIQHSDLDKEWQKSQLQNVEQAVKQGDMDAQGYAYLYDRIKINDGEKQRYGTQFAMVDPKNGLAELAETEDVQNLDKRRMEIGMMPSDIYKKVMLISIRK